MKRGKLIPFFFVIPLAQNSETLNSIKQLSEIPVKISCSLEVNTSTRFREIVFQDEEAGIEQLISLSERAIVEEAWFYLPKNNAWIEVGHKSYRCGVIANNDFFYSMLENSNELVLYHIHTSLEHPRVQSHLLDDAFPSPNDIRKIIISTQYFRSTNADGKISAKVCSKFGTTEFSLTRKGVEYFSANLKDITPYSEKYIERAHSLYETDETISLEELAKRISDDKMVMSFTSRYPSR